MANSALPCQSAPVARILLVLIINRRLKLEVRKGRKEEEREWATDDVWGRIEFEICSAASLGYKGHCFGQRKDVTNIVTIMYLSNRI